MHNVIVLLRYVISQSMGLAFLSQPPKLFLLEVWWSHVERVYEHGYDKPVTHDSELHSCLVSKSMAVNRDKTVLM